MRLTALLTGDVRFQYKYGFYFIYVVFSVLYIGLLHAFPEAWRGKAAILMIFSDPSAMGLFFMGAILLFEKSEHVLNSIAVSPVKPLEYVLSKLASIGIIATVVGLAIGISAGVVTHPFFFIAGVFLCSCIFSSIGLILACNVSSLNQFVLATIPAELLINIPAVLWLFGYRRSWLALHPGVSMMTLCTGEGPLVPALLILLLWTALMIFVACRTVEKMLQSVGGVTL